MSKGKKRQPQAQKKSGNQDKAFQTIVLITAILNLIKALVDFISRLME